MKKLKLDIVFNQNDPAWKELFLGFNTVKPYTIGGFGCKLCSYATYLRAIGKDVTPKSLNDTFRNAKLFTNQDGSVGNGLLSDEAVTTIFGDVPIYYKSAKYDGLVPDSVIAKIKSLIDGGYLVFAEVDFYPSTPNEDMHFVVIYGYDDAGNYLIADPWTGTKILLSTYGQPARVLYRIWSYGSKLTEESAMISIAQKMYEWLIGRATAIKSIAEYLGFGDPDNTPSDSIINTIKGIKSTATTAQNNASDLEKKLAVANTEIVNRIDQVANVRKECQTTIDTYIAQLDALKTTDKNNAELVGSMTGTIKELQGTIRDLQKDGGTKDITITKLRTEVESLKKSNYNESIEKLIATLKAIFRI